MRRGDIYLIDFEPSVAGQPANRRPAVLLTNDKANSYLAHVVVAPITTNMRKRYEFDVVLPAGTCGLAETSRIQLNYLRGLNRSRIGTYVGSLPVEQLNELDWRLKEHLALD